MVILIIYFGSKRSPRRGLVIFSIIFATIRSPLRGFKIILYLIYLYTAALRWGLRFSMAKKNKNSPSRKEYQQPIT